MSNATSHSETAVSSTAPVDVAVERGRARGMKWIKRFCGSLLMGSGLFIGSAGVGEIAHNGANVDADIAALVGALSLASSAALLTSAADESRREVMLEAELLRREAETLSN